MNKKLRVVFIGAGSRANQVIYPAFNMLDNVSIEAICDIDQKKLHDTADKYSIELRYGKDKYDYQNMINDVLPDAVIAIGNPHEFYDIWHYCLDMGYNLFIEKPFALNMHQATMLEYLANKYNCVTAVSFQRRYTPMVVQLRDRCLEKGKIVHAVCKFYKSNIEARYDARDHMMDDCVHSIDTLRWICGGEVVHIESDIKRINVPDINFISATLYFDNGANGYLINSWSSGKRIFSVEIHAPNIFVEAEHERKGYIYENGDVVGIEVDTKEAAMSDDYCIYTGVKAVAEDFVSCCLYGGQPATNFSDAIKTMEIAEKILAQGLLSGK